MAGELQPIGGSRPPASVDEVIIPMTHSLLTEALEKAAAKATAAARAQATRELKQSLDAQAAAKDEERDELVKRLRVEWEDQAVHRVRAARLWAALVAFALGATVFTTLMIAIDRQRVNAGIDAGIEAMGRSRMLDDILEDGKAPAEQPIEDCDNITQACPPGVRRNGVTIRSPEPPDAPRR